MLMGKDCPKTLNPKKFRTGKNRGNLLRFHSFGFASTQALSFTLAKTNKHLKGDKEDEEQGRYQGTVRELESLTAQKGGGGKEPAPGKSLWFDL